MVQPTGPAIYSHTLPRHSRPAESSPGGSPAQPRHTRPGRNQCSEKPHTVLHPTSTALISPGVASLRGKHIARECHIPVILLRRDDFPLRGTMRDNDTPPSPGHIGESGKFIRGSSPGLLVGTSVCPPCISSTHNCPRLLNNPYQQTPDGRTVKPPNETQSTRKSHMAGNHRRSSRRRPMAPSRRNQCPRGQSQHNSNVPMGPIPQLSPEPNALTVP